MATPAGKLASAIAAKDADAATVAFAELEGQPMDARMCAGACNMFARNRKNQQAWDAFERGRSAHGMPKLIGAGLSLNALCYACCRETSMADKAMEVWALLAEHGVPPEAEPTEKLLLMNLSRHRYDDAFGVFLGAIDAQLQPSAAACTALVRTAAVVPKHAQSAFAVMMTMKGAQMTVPSELLALLMRACLSCGTVDQCLELQAELDARDDAPPDHQRNCRVVIKMAEASSQMATKAAEVLKNMKAKAEAAEGDDASAQPGNAKAYEAVLLALSRAAMARTNPAACIAAHAVLEDMIRVGHSPSRSPLTLLLTSCCRTGQRRQALTAFRALMASPPPKPTDSKDSKDATAPPPVESALARSLALTLGKTMGSTSWHEVAETDVRLLLSVMGPDAEADKEVASALVRLTAAAGMLLDARKRLAAMCAARDPPTPPGGALLATFIAACGKHPSGPEEGCRAFAELSKEGPLALSKHVDIWMSLMAACCAQGRAPVGLIFYKLLRTRGVEADERSSLALFAALEAGAHAEGAFELRTLLELRGFALTELHGGKGAGAGAGAGGQSSRAAAAPSAAAPSAAAPSAAAPSAAARESLVAANSSGDAMDIGETAEHSVVVVEDTSEPLVKKPSAARKTSTATASSSPPPAAATSSSSLATAPPARSSSSDGGGSHGGHGGGHGPSLGVDAQHATLAKMLSSALKEERISGAIDAARRAIELGRAPDEAQLLELLGRLFDGDQTEAAISLFEMLRRPGGAAAGDGGDGNVDGVGAHGRVVSRRLMLSVLEGVCDDKKGGAKYALCAVDIFNELRALGEGGADGGGGDDDGDGEDGRADGTDNATAGPLTPELLRKLLKAVVKAGMLEDAYEVLAHTSRLHDLEVAAANARAKAAKGGKRGRQAGGGGGAGGGGAADGMSSVSGVLRRMRSDLLSMCVRHNQLQRACVLFHALVASGGPPHPASGASLLDSLCARGMATDAERVLSAMSNANQPLTVKLGCQVVTALTRAGVPMRAFAVFEQHLEPAGGAEATIASSLGACTDWNVEHALALLTKALSKAMRGRQAHRVYTCAQSQGLCTNYGSYGLPALTMACIDAGMLSQAIAVCEDARQALLPVGITTGSALLTALAKAQLGPQLKASLAEVAQRRLPCDAPSLARAFECLMSQTPPSLEDAAKALMLAAAATRAAAATTASGWGTSAGAGGGKAGGGGGGALQDAGLDPAAARAVRKELPTMLHRLCEALCKKADEGRAVRALKGLREHGVTPQTATCVLVAGAWPPPRSAVLTDLVTLLITMRRAMGKDEYDQAARRASPRGRRRRRCLASTRGGGGRPVAGGGRRRRRRGGSSSHRTRRTGRGRREGRARAWGALRGRVGRQGGARGPCRGTDLGVAARTRGAAHSLRAAVALLDARPGCSSE